MNTTPIESIVKSNILPRSGSATLKQFKPIYKKGLSYGNYLISDRYFPVSRKQ